MSKEVPRPRRVIVLVADEFVNKFIETDVQFVGGYRRGNQQLGDADILTGDDMLALRARCEKAGLKIETKKLSEKRLNVRYRGVLMNIFHSFPEYWGAALFKWTGPKGYVIGFTRRAKAMGFRFSEYGVRDKTGRVIAARTEEEVCKVLGKKCKPPGERGI